MNFVGLNQQFYRFIADKRRPDGSPYIVRSLSTEEELQNLAHTYLQDMVNKPEHYVICPDQNSVDCNRFFITDDGKDIFTLDDVELLEECLSHDEEKVNIWLLKYADKIAEFKQQEAQKIMLCRAMVLKDTASKLMQSITTCSATVAAQIMYFISRYCAKLDADGNINYVKIKKNNRHALMTMSDRMIACIVQCLNEPISVKRACKQGIQLYYSRILQSGHASGWVEFKQSSFIEDAEKLQVACRTAPWCIAEDTSMAHDYLKEYSFYVYYDMKSPVAAVYYTEDCYAEIAGSHDNEQIVDTAYKQEIEMLLTLKGFNMRENFSKPAVHFIERESIQDIVFSIREGKASYSLFQKIYLNSDNGEIGFHKLECGRLKLSDFVLKQLHKLVSIEDVLEVHKNGTVTVHGSLDIADNLSIRNQVVEIKGDLRLFGANSVNLPCLKRIGGYLDLRNACDIYFPSLKYVGGTLDSSGSTRVLFPNLNYVSDDEVDDDGEDNMEIDSIYD